MAGINMDSDLTQLDSMLNAIVQAYDKATPVERESMSPFFKMFHDMVKSESVEGGAE